MSNINDSEDFDKLNGTLEFAGRLYPGATMKEINENLFEITQIHDDGNYVVSYRTKDGIMHRDDDEPTIYSYNKNDELRSITYIKKGKEHREGDRPSSTSFFPGTGSDVSYHYKQNNEYHRGYNQPAMVSYKDGEVFNELFYENGEDITKEVMKIRKRKEILKDIKNV